MNYVVITSIHPPTPSVERMAATAVQHGVKIIVVGDRKTPDVSWPTPVEFQSLADQNDCSPHLSAMIEENHYARKNLGYAALIRREAAAIFDTDDDNAPVSEWKLRNSACRARVTHHPGWLNIYSLFSSALIWPRGLPLEAIRKRMPYAPGAETNVIAPIQQGLVNGSPDVDAVWRLVLDSDFTFEPHASVALSPGTWCPFNSQSTWWFPEAYPLMYLPSLVSFRMTDIWRSFVAQRCIWELGRSIVFHAPDMIQVRNPHNLLSDFKQEIPGYLANERIRGLLEDLNLSPGPDAVGTNLHRCYETLVAAAIVPPGEMPILDAWLRAIEPA